MEILGVGRHFLPVIRRSQALLSGIGALWCTVMHQGSEMWPISGRYQCRRCLRYRQVRWDENADRNATMAGSPTRFFAREES